MDVSKINLFGIPISKLGMRETVEYLTDAILHRRSHHVITINPIMVMSALEHRNAMAMMQRAELIIPDGTGVVWAAQQFGTPVTERVPGIELLHELMRIGERYKWKVFMLGATSDVIHKAAEKIALTFPQIEIVGTHDGYFSDEEDDAILEQICGARPDLLFVGRSADKQDLWIDRYKSRLDIPVMMGVGGSFDVLAGKVKRAPVLFRKLRLEWFHRLLREPSRYKRMLDLPKFMFKVIRERKNATSKPK